MTWTIELPLGRGLLRADEQLSDARTADLARSIRRAVMDLASRQQIPALARAHVIAEYRPPHPRHRQRGRQTPTLFADASSLLPSAKAAVDGLRDAGVLLRDSAHLTGPVMRLGDLVAGSQLVLHIRENA